MPCIGRNKKTSLIKQHCSLTIRTMYCTLRVLIHVGHQTVYVDEETGQVSYVRLSTEVIGVYRVNVTTTTFSR
jgi:hypothetical protein